MLFKNENKIKENILEYLSNELWDTIIYTDGSFNEIDGAGFGIFIKEESKYNKLNYKQLNIH